MNRSLRGARVRVKPGAETRSERLIRTLIAGRVRPSDVIELCYWSREPGMVELIRAIATMPEETRAALEAFIALVGNAKSIEARLDPQGALTLASPEASKTIALARYVAENDSDSEDAARCLN